MRHDPAGVVVQTAPLEPSHLFGEGIAHYHVWTTDEDSGKRMREHRLIQLTWTSKVGRVYSLPDLRPLGEFSFDTSTGEGWGITFVPHRNEFYVSDGSEYLAVWDAETLEEKRRIAVTLKMEPGSRVARKIRYVNELEFVDFAVTPDDDGDNTATTPPGGDDNDARCAEGGRTCSDDGSPPSFSSSMAILANLWYQDVLVSIDPESGEINRVFDLGDIYPRGRREEDGADCLNGITVTGRRRKSNEGLEIWVTGKLWPSMYRIELNADHIL
jgi:glutamine cyclotransferase